jgi:hypothetical protein
VASRVILIDFSVLFFAVLGGVFWSWLFFVMLCWKDIKASRMP